MSTDEFRTCRSCRASSALFQVWSVTAYKDLAKDVVYKLKFERGRAAASIISEQMAVMLLLPARTDWVITSIPTANSRIRRRGYDQAQLMAKSLSRKLDNSYSTLLARQGSSRQLGQTREARRAQMLGALIPIGDRADGKHILLVDDVLTTGATLEAAASALKKAGAKRVSAAVFAVA